MSPDHYDLIVLGSGQGGGPLAGAFAKAGRRAALVERTHVGGTCVNEGCSPTKTMVASARVAHLARRGEEFGVNVGPVRIDLARVRERKQAVVESFRSGSERGLGRAGVDVAYGNGRFTGPRAVAVDADGATRLLTADRVVISTGLSPVIPPIDGLDTVPFLTSSSIMELTAVPEHLVVIGGGVIGLEFGQMFRRFGAQVTILQRAGRLVPREDDDVSSAIREFLEEDGVRVITDAEVTRVGAHDGAVEVEVEVAGSTQVAAGSHLLVATGRRPNIEALDLAVAGVRSTRRGHVKVNSRLETNVPGVFAIGDVTGGPAFTHMAYDDFRILRTNLLDGGKASTRGRLVPYTMFTDPQLGRVGMTEREARKAGREVRVATLPMAHVARAIETDEMRGFMKAVVDAKTHRILGAAILGVEGGEVASVLQVAMMGRLPWQRLRDSAFSHPTFSEALNNLFMTL